MEPTSMDEDDEVRQARFRRVRAASDADLPALTILRGRRYLARYPDHGYAWRLFGIALLELARYDEAEHAISNALRLCPEEKRQIPLCDMGCLFKFQGDYEQAAGWFQKAIDAVPRDTQGYIYLGSLLALQGRLREAEEVHRQATETCYEGCLDEAFLNLGLVLRAKNDSRRRPSAFARRFIAIPSIAPRGRRLRDVERCLNLREHRL